jgi:hypothetical protein
MNFKKGTIIIGVLFLTFSSYATSKLEKAFEALAIYDYFKAKEIFTKSLKKHECGASFGLSKIYLNDKNPFHNLDSARVYGLRSEESWLLTKEKEKFTLQELFINKDSILVHLDRVANSAFIFATSKNTVDEFEYFIAAYDYSPLIFEANKLRLELIYEEVMGINTAAAYKEFIDLYPDAEQYDVAFEKYQLRVFEESTSLSRISDIEAFIINYPSSPYIRKAQDKLFGLSTSNKRLSDYKNFINTYPTNPNVEKCWEIIYRIETKHLSPGVLVNFLLDYPEYPYSHKIKEEISSLILLKIPTRINNKWGFIDTSGNWIIKPQFESCEPFIEGMSLYSENGLFGFINTKGEIIIEAIYEDADAFNNGLAIVNSGEKYGVLNRFGVEKVAFDYEDIGEFINGVAYASKKGKYGYINEEGFVVVPFIYDLAFSFNNRKALVKRGGKFGVVDLENNWIIPFNYDWIEPYFSDSLIKVRIDKNLGLINIFGEVILPIEYDQIGKINSELLIVVKDSKVGYVNAKGDNIIPLIYESDPFIMDWGEFKDGLARIKIKHKMGLIDTSGERIIPAIFEKIGDFEGDLFPVKKRGKWGYSDLKIKLKISYKFDEAYPFHGGIAKVRKKNSWGFIDENAKELIPIIYSKITAIQGLYIVEKDSLFGMMDYSGNEVLSTVFDKIEYNELGFFLIEVKGKLAYLDIDRRKVFWKEDGFSMP